MSSTKYGLQEIKDALNNIESIAAENSIGKMIVSGIGVGIEQNSYLAVTAMENVYVELETLSKNAAKNAEALEKKRHQRSIANLKNSLELNLISEKEYYEKLKEYRDQNFRQGSDDWYKYTEEIIFYNKRLADEAEKQQKQLLSRLKEIRDELTEKLQMDDVEWFSANKITFKGMGEKGRDLVYNVSDISTFEKEIFLLEQYRTAILSLKEIEGIPDGIFTDIAKMSVEDGLTAANAILNADDFKRSRFISGYDKLNSLSESIANELNPILNKEKIEGVALEAAEAFNEAFFNTDKEDKSAFITMLEESFSSVPDSYYSLGGNAASAFENGFMQDIPEIMSHIQSYIQSSINSIVSGLTSSASTRLALAVPSGNTYNSKYVFNTSRDTTTQQLLAAQRDATLLRLRGVNR